MMPTLLVDLFVTSSLCIAHRAVAAGADAPTDSGARARCARAARRAHQSAAVGDPCRRRVVGVRHRAAGPVDTIVKMLADAASPVALFTIGAVLWRAGQHAHTRTPPALYLPVALIKLFLHPLLVFALAAARSGSACR